jgi:hypothetical protein
MATCTEFVYWDGGARYVPLVCAPRQPPVPCLRLVPSHAGAPQDTPRCSHQHCDLLYGGCEHCPFCSTTPPLQLADNAPARRQRLALHDPFLRVLQKNLDNAVARVHLQSGLADRRELVNDYSVQRAQARVFAYRQKLGLDQPARPENTMELILRIPTRIKVFRVRNKGYYCHAIALLCGPPVQPYMVSVLEEVSTGALFSAGRMIDVKFRVECPQFLSRKRVLGLLGGVAEVGAWKRMQVEPGEMDENGREYAPCLDQALVDLVQGKVRSLGDEAAGNTIDIALPSEYTHTLVFVREYIKDPREKTFWWVPLVGREDMNRIVRGFVTADATLWNDSKKYTWNKEPDGKKMLFQEKRSELDTNVDGLRLYDKWDLPEHVTYENANFTMFCDQKDLQTTRQNIDTLKQWWLSGMSVSKNAKERIKAKLHRMRSESEVHLGVELRTQTLTAMNAAITFLRQELLTVNSTRNVVMVFLAHVDIWPVHWSPNATSWRKLATRPPFCREISDEQKGNLETWLSAYGFTQKILTIPHEQLDVDVAELESNCFFQPLSSLVFWVPLVEGDEKSTPGSARSVAPVADASVESSRQSLFVKALEVIQDWLNEIKQNDPHTPITTEDILLKDITDNTASWFTSSPRPDSVDIVNGASQISLVSFLFPSHTIAIRHLISENWVGIDWLLSVLSDLLLVKTDCDFLHSNHDNKSKTLVFPVGFFNKNKLSDQDSDDGVEFMQTTPHQISNYHTLIFPGWHEDMGLFFAYVSLRPRGNVFAYSVATGQTLERVRRHLRRFVNRCLQAEYGDDSGSIPRLTRGIQQSFFTLNSEWQCCERDQLLLLMTWVVYFCDRRIFDFDPGDEEDMDKFRLYFADFIARLAQ